MTVKVNSLEKTKRRKGGIDGRVEKSAFTGMPLRTVVILPGFG